MLLTKLFLPELRPNRVERPRLLDRLKQESQCQLVIISAPAGFGKTSLVSEWVRTERGGTAWISLDESDNDPVQFWTGLVAAIDQLFPGTGKNSQSMLASKQISPKILITTLLNDLAQQTGSSAPACLVLDDTHLATHAAIYEGLLFLIERLPRSLRLILIGRSDPPLPLGRLRASCRLLEIRAGDLRFNLEESEDFLNRVMGFAISKERVKQLEERTEGWIAGLQLAGLAMQGLEKADHPERLDAFIENFSGDDRYILDYLVEEVLSQLPQEVVAFLLQTSILDRMCGPLCDTVTGLEAGESQSMLERCERENLFLIPLDNRRQWYRYHHLFADLLRKQFERLEGGKAKEKAAELHRRAAGWLAGRDCIPEAIGHALQGCNFERAAEWIEAYAQSGIDRGEYATLKNWIERLPQNVLYSSPDLLMHYAWTLNYLGELEAYKQPLAAAEQLWREQGKMERLGEALNLRADFAAALEDFSSTAQLAQQALDLLPEEDCYHRGMSWTYLGSAAFLQGDMDKAQHALDTASALCKLSGNKTGLHLVTLLLAQVRQHQGRLPEAAQRMEEVISQTGNLLTYEGLAARILLSLIWREWNRLDEAEQALRSGLETIEKFGQAVYFLDCYLDLARILWEKGDLDGMQAALEKQAQLSEPVEGSGGRAPGYALSALLAALSGDLDTARSWKERNEAILNSPVSFQNEYLCLTFAHISIRLGPEEARQALALLDSIANLARAQGRIQCLLEVWMLKALGFSRLGDLESALEALEESLKLASSGGYRRMYLDEGQPLSDLLVLLARKPSLSPELRAYATQLLSLAPSTASQDLTASAQTANLALIEPLTARELEVLRMIQAGLSNREIAEKLYLTLNTVKVHAKNIFAKLDVQSRTQAVRRAEELGLI